MLLLSNSSLTGLDDILEQLFGREESDYVNQDLVVGKYLVVASKFLGKSSVVGVSLTYPEDAKGNLFDTKSYLDTEFQLLFVYVPLDKAKQFLEASDIEFTPEDFLDGYDLEVFHGELQGEDSAEPRAGEFWVTEYGTVLVTERGEGVTQTGHIVSYEDIVEGYRQPEQTDF